jgi:phage shock protein C
MDENVPDVARPDGPKRLYRSKNQRIFLGVCGGLGEYFDLDPTIVRVLFVVGAIFAGTSVAVYAVLALIMPAEDSIDLEPRVAAQETLREATSEVQRGAAIATTRVKELFGRKNPPDAGA